MSIESFMGDLYHTGKSAGTSVRGFVVKGKPKRKTKKCPRCGK